MADALVVAPDPRHGQPARGEAVGERWVRVLLERDGLGLEPDVLRSGDPAALGKRLLERPILRKDASLAEIESILKEMPRLMILELWKAVGDACPGWGPAKPKAKSIEEAEAKN